MSYIEELGEKAKIASRELLKIGTKTKNDVLLAIADELINKKEEIKAANKIDLEKGEKNGLSFALLDRMTLTDSRIEGIRSYEKWLRSQIQLEKSLQDGIIKMEWALLKREFPLE